MDVPLSRASALRNGNDVIEFQPFVAAAFDALSLVSLPDKHPDVVRYSLTARRLRALDPIVGLQLTPQLLVSLLVPQHRVRHFKLLLFLA